jgi:acetyl esterase/lipase
VRARDDHRPPQPRGKQSREYSGHGALYGRTTGIWQTVWLEAVDRTHLRRPRVTPDVGAGRFRIELPPGHYEVAISQADTEIGYYQGEGLLLEDVLKEQILLALKSSGFVASKKGKGGGYVLAQPPETITVGSVIRAIEGPLAPLKVAFGPRALTPEGRESLGREISPIYFVTSHLPPTLIIHGDDDKVVPLQQSETFVKRAKDADAKNVELIVRPGKGHGWGDFWKSNEDISAFADWFDRHLRDKSE